MPFATFAEVPLAIELGYGSSSSFGVMFKRTLGATPGRYFEA
jgi:AraC-like DNA-binding protein